MRGDFSDNDVTYTMSVPEREVPGFGCPHCGAPIDITQVGPMFGLRCCGHVLDGPRLSRLLAARQVWLREKSGE